ncbi:MAG: T9SS type A sorting domain-containing protein [Ignavibacteriae bacterium]|nr:T9SS type A sorting domain-containing protein [Ignavibacteriota bacterium]
MKKIFLIILTIGLFSQVFGQTHLTPHDVVLSGHITSNTTLDANNVYLLSGYVYVDSLVSLTIPAGTVILGESSTKGSLIVKRGGKIYANGTATNPIVFTSQLPAGSRAMGDWGGVIILGAASNWKGLNVAIEGVPTSEGAVYGGTNDADNSGVFKYVRIEFPGIELSANNEINGLTLGSVGSGTEIHHVQVSYSRDDAFEWFGGNHDASHLIAIKSLDDDFDGDEGYRGNIQYGFIFRDSWTADVSKSEAFEQDSKSGSPLTAPISKPIFSNITAVGPKQNSSQTAFDPEYYYGIHQREGSQMNLFNSVITGFDEGGIFFDGSNAVNQVNLLLDNTVEYEKNYIAGLASSKPLVSASDNDGTVIDALAWFNADNYSAAEVANLNLADPFNFINPNVEPTTGSPLLGSASFSNTKLAGFETTTYVGAFSKENRWDAGWAHYDPQSVSYRDDIDWTASIVLTNNNYESRQVVFGSATTATSGLDNSLGELAAPTNIAGNIDIRFDITGSDDVFLNLQNASSAVTYSLKGDFGSSSGTATLTWNPAQLGPGRFTLKDGLSGAIFADVNMKTQSSVSFTQPGATFAGITIEVATTFNHSQNILTSWNLISFPGYNMTSMQASSIYPTMSVAWGWNNATGVYENIATTSNIVPAKAFWLKSTGNAAITQTNLSYVQRNNVQRNNVQISTGWNLIGAYDYAYATADIRTAPSSAINSSTVYWGYSNGYEIKSTVNPGTAVWVKSLAAGELIIPTQDGPALPKNESIINEEWAKIIISDANGMRYTLYIADKDENLERFEMPPVPSEDVFDIRFSSNRLVDVINGSKDIKLNGVKYPVTVKLEGTNLEITGHQVKNGEEFVVSEAVNYLINISGSSVLSVPTEYTLEQNYPNPFNPTTVIRFSLPETANVKLRIYNSLGELVETLVDETVEAGFHSVNWNAKGLSSGLYFYELTSSNFVSVQKMMLLK